MHQGRDVAVHHREALRSPLPAVALPPLRAVEVLDQLRERVRLLHYSRRTEEAYVVHWCRALIRFHGIRHHRELGSPEVEAFLNWLANERRVAASTHKQVFFGAQRWCQGAPDRSVVEVGSWPIRAVDVRAP